MLIYDILKRDHDRIKFLLTELAELTEDDVKWHSVLISQLQEALIPHSKAEENAFYDAIHAKNKAKNIALHGYQEHLSIEYLLRTVHLKDRSDQDWKSNLLQLKAAVEHHISDEENAIFPLAQQLFSEQEAYLMGQKFTQLRDIFKQEQNQSGSATTTPSGASTPNRASPAQARTNSSPKLSDRH